MSTRCGATVMKLVGLADCYEEWLRHSVPFHLGYARAPLIRSSNCRLDGVAELEYPANGTTQPCLTND